MNRTIFTVLILAIGLVFLTCSDNPADSKDPDPPRELTGQEKIMAESGNDFAFNLYKAVSESASDLNLFISPLSVSYALGMAYNGASGETRGAIASTLELSGLTLEEINQSYKSLMDFLTTIDPKVDVSIANSMWPREGFTLEDEFVNLNTQYFDAETQALDFSDNESVNVINGWVSEKTHDKITSIIRPPIDPYTVLYLINAVYFKGDWTYQFDPNETEERDFYAFDGSTVQCQMMRQEADFPAYTNDDFALVDLPYSYDRYRMAVILPKGENNVNDIVNMLTADSWSSWMESLGNKTVDLYMPRFKMETKYELNEMLKSLGMEIAFTPAADFSGISSETDLMISEVLHKAFVEVNEEGTEAAAVTSVGFVEVAEPDDLTMLLNKPYIFIIHEVNSNAIMFMGKMMNPEQG